uniref:F-box/WD-40 repeat-containing protein At3g52030 n=1 Tax=Anthurium amnicola TaxID=1678845 RepID=A0A1D1YFX9_9ARAE
MEWDGSSRASGRWRRSSSGGPPAVVRSGGSSIGWLGADVLCAIFALLDHFDVARCAAVCKSWHSIISTSSLLRDLFMKRAPNVFGTTDLSVPSGSSLNTYLEELAMEQHRLALLHGNARVHQWNGHSVRVSHCRMRRGLILTGVGDKVVGLIGSQICIWRRHSGKTSILQPKEGTFARSLSMCYSDPEAVVGCEDGRCRVFDMYGGNCSRIIRMHAGPVTCLCLTDEQLIIGGSSFGSITVADLSSGERVAVLKSTISPIGISSLCFNMHSYLVFAGSTAGYSHCWDLRTLRPLWESRISSNVIYAVHHLSRDTSTLATGGIDGVLRVLNQQTGEVLSSYVTAEDDTVALSSDGEGIKKYRVRAIPNDVRIDSIPKSRRSSITCLAVGMKKIVTTHNERYIRLWGYNEKIKL